MKTQTQPVRRISLPTVCPDYDEDCLDMSYEDALHCYEGFPDNEHLQKMGYGPEGLGLSYGHCPILTRLN